MASESTRKSPNVRPALPDAALRAPDLAIHEKPARFRNFFHELPNRRGLHQAHECIIYVSMYKYIYVLYEKHIYALDERTRVMGKKWGKSDEMGS